MGSLPSAAQLAVSGQRLGIRDFRQAIQPGQGTLVLGTFTVAAGVEITADSVILLTLAANPTGSANYAGLAVVSRTVGLPGTGDFTVEAIIADGTIDADAAGLVDFLIIG